MRLDVSCSEKQIKKKPQCKRRGKIRPPESMRENPQKLNENIKRNFKRSNDKKPPNLVKLKRKMK